MNEKSEIIARIRDTPGMLFDDPDDVPGIDLSLLPKRLADEVGWFFSEFPYLGLYLGEEFGGNRWQLHSSFLDMPIGGQYPGTESGGVLDYLWNYMTFGFGTSEGVLGICIAEESFGRIAWVPESVASDGGNVPLIANSFMEWIKRTLDAGPDIPYFFRPDFGDLGPALPNDKLYEPIEPWDVEEVQQELREARGLSEL